MSKLDQVVFLIEDGKIKESAIRDLTGYIDTTTTPKGVAPRFHIRAFPMFSIDGEEFDSREGAEQYAADNGLTDSEISEKVSHELWTWGHQGRFPHVVERFETAQEAQEALEDTFAYDFWESANILAFTTREDAEKWVAENSDTDKGE